MERRSPPDEGALERLLPPPPPPDARYDPNSESPLLPPVPWPPAPTATAYVPAPLMLKASTPPASDDQHVERAAGAVGGEIAAI
jgi:hypothetical protein